MEHSPSELQRAVYSFVEHGRGSAVVVATAGSGKTTTICGKGNFPGAIDYVRKGLLILLTSFSNAIVSELGKRIGERGLTSGRLTVRGMHSLCMSMVGTALRGKAKISQDGTSKAKNLAFKAIPKTEWYYVDTVIKLVSLMKNAGLGLTGFAPCDTASVNALVEHHAIELNPRCPESADIDTAIQYAIDVFKTSISSKWQWLIDFDDMLYFPLMLKLNPRNRFDVIFADESQDLSPIQHHILKILLAPNGRVIAIGDKRQAIYGFRGADSSSLDTLKAMFNATELPLTVSYRCPLAVVEHCKEIAPEITACENAPIGLIEYPNQWDVTQILENDMVLCRNNAPLVKMAYEFIRAGLAVHVLGRDIGKNLIAIAESTKAVSIDELMVDLTAKRDKAENSGKYNPENGFTDSIDCLFEIIAARNVATMEQLKTEINNLFSDSVEKRVLSSIHRAKGLEANRVWILDAQLMPSKYAVKDWQLTQESNLMFVARSRTKSELRYIQSHVKE